MCVVSKATSSYSTGKIMCVGTILNVLPQKDLPENHNVSTQTAHYDNHEGGIYYETLVLNCIFTRCSRLINWQLLSVENISRDMRYVSC